MAFPSRSTASDFFQELEAASRVSRRTACGSEALSPWGDAALPPGRSFKGAVLHYTAGGSLQGAVRWLTMPCYQAKASAHVVIGRGREAWADAAVPKGGLLDQLPASVVQLRTRAQTAWHATWANNAGYYGLEAVSWGEVRPNAAGKWCGPDGQNRYVDPIEDQISCFQAAGRGWQGYTQAQLITLCKLMEYYAAAEGAPFAAEHILGHDHVQGVRTLERPGEQKRDAGVWLYWDQLRATARGQELQTYAPMGAPRPGPSLEAVQRVEAMPDRKAAAIIQLGWLGYVTDGGLKAPAPGATSLYTAQRMLGLTPDMVVGPKTAAALAWRVRDRWLAA